MKHLYKFHLGEVVWYHLPDQPNRAVKARITSTSRIGQIGFERYSVERLDIVGHEQIHNVELARLSRPHNPAIPQFTNGECHHAAL